MQRLDLNRSEFADLAQIISPQVNQHIVLGKLLLVRKKFRFKRFVFFIRFTSRSGSGKWEGMQHSVFQFDKGFGRSACDLDVCA